MTNYDSLDHGKKQDLKNQLIKYATLFGGKTVSYTHLRAHET